MAKQNEFLADLDKAHKKYIRAISFIGDSDYQYYGHPEFLIYAHLSQYLKLVKEKKVITNREFKEFMHKCVEDLKKQAQHRVFGTYGFAPASDIRTRFREADNIPVPVRVVKKKRKVEATNTFITIFAIREGQKTETETFAGKDKERDSQKYLQQLYDERMKEEYAVPISENNRLKIVVRHELEPKKRGDKLNY